MPHDPGRAGDRTGRRSPRRRWSPGRGGGAGRKHPRSRARRLADEGPARGRRRDRDRRSLPPRAPSVIVGTSDRSRGRSRGALMAAPPDGYVRGLRKTPLHDRTPSVNLSDPALTFALALVAGIVAQSAARHLRVPGIVLLLL